MPFAERTEWVEKLQKSAAYIETLAKQARDASDENVILKSQLEQSMRQNAIIKTAMALVEDLAVEPFMSFEEMISTGEHYSSTMSKEAAPRVLPKSTLSIGKVATNQSRTPGTSASDRMMLETLKIGDE
jgi:hypothetical protein